MMKRDLWTTCLDRHWRGDQQWLQEQIHYTEKHMFMFYRTSQGATEVWTIGVEKDSLPDAEARFGAALWFGGRPPEYGGLLVHDVGVLVATHKAEEVEFLLCWKDGLREDEQRRLQDETEHLLGHHVYCGGSEPIRGWFLHDSLKS